MPTRPSAARPPTRRPRGVALATSWLALALAIGTAAMPARADTVHVAVAANFHAPMRRIAAAFERDSGHSVRLSSGATGKLHAQIINGAPYDLLLAADEESPRRLVAEGAGVDGTRSTYAVGRLVLWSAQPGLVDANGQVLRDGRFRHLAIANPKTAPYGGAAVQTLEALGLRDALGTRLVQGENIAQAWQFVASGNAELGFVALSQVAELALRPPAARAGDDVRAAAPGSMWLVPDTLHRPIRQDMVLLARSADKAAARALLRFMGSDTARGIVQHSGYALPPPT